MVLDMKVNGEKVKLVVMASFIILTEIFTMDNGQTTKLTAMELILMLRVLSMRDIGRMISNTVRV